MKVFERRSILININLLLVMGIFTLFICAKASADSGTTVETPEFLSLAKKLAKDIVQMKYQANQKLTEINDRCDSISKIDKAIASAGDQAKKMELRAQKNHEKKLEIALRKKGVQIIKAGMSQAIDYLNKMKGNLQYYKDASSAPVSSAAVNSYNDYFQTSTEMTAKCLGLDEADPRLWKLMQLLERKFGMSIQTSSFLGDCINNISDFQKEIELLMAELDVAEDGLELDTQGIEMSDHGLALAATLSAIDDGMKTIGGVVNRSASHISNDFVNPLPKGRIPKVCNKSQKDSINGWLKGKTFNLKK